MNTKRIILVLLAANIFIWQAILFVEKASNELAFYFFSVGQGDSQLISLPGNVQILIDGGPGPRVLKELSKALPEYDRYIDLVVETHPDFDHFAGLIDVLKSYKVGAVIKTGRRGIAQSYKDLERIISEKEIMVINLFAGDRIRYQDYWLSALSPSAKDINAKNVNNAGLVLVFGGSSPTALFTADIDAEKERQLIKKYDLAADILKVSHHGSKYSSVREFLNKVKPRLAVIGVGKNSYGHPTKDVLERLANIGSTVLRTDFHGTVKVLPRNGRLEIYSL